MLPTSGPLPPHHPLLMRESAQRRALKKWEGIEASAAKPEGRQWAARNAALLREMLAETETQISEALRVESGRN